MATNEPRKSSNGGRPSRQPASTAQRRDAPERRSSSQRRTPSNNSKRREPTSNRRPSSRRPSQRPTKRPVPRQRKRRTTAEVSYTPNTWLRIFSLLLVVIVFVAGIAIFFRVEEIAVTGNALYTVEELQNASGVEQGDNLLILSKGDIAGSIMAVLPYVEEVRISKELPNRLTIDIVESEASYMIKGDDSVWWLINSDGKLLEQVSASAGTYPTISGMTAVDPVAGMDVETENPDQIEAAVAVMGELESTDYLAKIVEINVEKPYEIIMYYEDIYQIELGGYDQMAYKIQYLTAVLEQLRETESGIIDLTLGEDKVARFRPW